MADVAIIETGNGGDLILKGNDIAMAEGYENMPYLSMFGGADWWGNSLLTGDASTLFSANTERVMNEVALNSSGRIKIEQAIKADLAHLEKNVPGTKVVVSTSIVSDNRLEINININGQQFYFMWNPDTAFLNYRT